MAERRVPKIQTTAAPEKVRAFVGFGAPQTAFLIDAEGKDLRITYRIRNEDSSGQRRYYLGSIQIASAWPTTVGWHMIVLTGDELSANKGLQLATEKELHMFLLKEMTA